MPPELIARAYFHYNGARYRVTVYEESVWIERQTPHAFAGNLQMAEVMPDDVLYGTETWEIENLPDAFEKYEKQLGES